MPNSGSNKVLFLFRELAGYFVACVEEFASLDLCEVEVVYWPVNAQAPLELNTGNNVRWIKKENWDRDAAIGKDQAGAYNCVIVSGWGDVDYNLFVRSNGRSKKILAFDTQWQSSPKIILGCLWMRWKWKSFYDNAWVPGVRQARLARALGFKDNDIATGFYVADLNGLENTNHHRESKDFHIGFVSRLVHEKGFPEILIDMLGDLDRNPSWKVHVWGTGPLRDSLPNHEQIVYYGFTQPDDLKKVWADIDVFVLASRYEPWGVVLHEAAGAGLPIITTSAVGAADSFVEHGKNGWIFSIGDNQSIYSALSKLNQMPNEDRAKMRALSFEKSKLINKKQWCETLKNWMK